MKERNVRRAAMALGLACTMLLAACGGGGHTKVGKMHSPGTLEAADYRARGIPRQFGDTKPHEWEWLSPARYEVHGIDASRYQGEIDWFRARSAGISFAWLKATEGGDYLDPGLSRNMPAARAAGMPVGAYHFYYFCRTAREQAEWFIDNVPKRVGDLPPVLDMEWNHTSRTCRLRPPADQVRADIRQFASMIERHYGTRPVIYTTPDFYAENGLGTLGGYDFWLRSVTAHPSERYPDERWSFWQYSGTGVVPGVKGKVDLNAFGGSPGQWQSWYLQRMQR